MSYYLKRIVLVIKKYFGKRLYSILKVLNLDDIFQFGFAIVLSKLHQGVFESEKLHQLWTNVCVRNNLITTKILMVRVGLIPPWMYKNPCK